MIKTNKTYRIELTFSNPYIGSRNGGNKVECENLTYAEASNWLLSKFNDLLDCGYANNWGIARIMTNKHITDSVLAYGRGESKFVECDSRIWAIVEEDN